MTNQQYSVVFYYASTSSDDLSSTERVEVTLPNDASPWDVYCQAEEALGDELFPPLSEGVDDWDDDGMYVERDGKSLSISGCMVSPKTTWADFH